MRVLGINAIYHDLAAAFVVTAGHVDGMPYSFDPAPARDDAEFAAGPGPCPVRRPSS